MSNAPPVDDYRHVSVWGTMCNVCKSKHSISHTECGHDYCSHCLDIHIQLLFQRGDETVPCPVCFDEFELFSNGNTMEWIGDIGNKGYHKRICSTTKSN